MVSPGTTTAPDLCAAELAAPATVRSGTEEGPNPAIGNLLRGRGTISGVRSQGPGAGEGASMNHAPSAHVVKGAQDPVKRYVPCKSRGRSERCTQG